MDQRAKRIKTTYDDKGSIDKEAYFNYQQQNYANQIRVFTHIDKLTKNQFRLKPLEIGFLQNTVVKDDLKYKQIKKVLADYNSNILKNTQEVDPVHLKKNVMDLLLKFMRLMMQAPDIKTKRAILDLTHYWMLQQFDPKAKRKTKDEMEKQVRHLLIQKQLLPIDIINKELIDTQMKNQLKSYHIKARTIYKELEAPKSLLENYHTHKLEFISEKLDPNVQRKKKWIDTVKFPKVGPPGYLIEEQEKQADKQIDGSQNNFVPNLDVNKQENFPTNQTQENVINENINDEQNQNLDLGEVNDEDDGNQQPSQAEEPGEKQKGKLDPLLKVFLLERIRQKQKGEVACQKRLLKAQNKSYQVHQEGINYLGHLKQWSSQKSRLKTQMAKKNQSMRGLDKLSRGKKQQNNQYQSFIQNEMNSIKIRKTIDEQYKNLSKVDLPPQNLNSQVGTSLFDRRRVRTEHSHQPFSSILKDNERAEEKRLVLQEISTIKQKFSKARIYTPMDKIVKGLVNPLQKDEQYTNQDGKVIWPHSQLLSNPFMKIAKKKKKKKKK